jgi:ABC-2 type transport system permease protein
MINIRLTSLIRKEFIQFLRDTRTLILVLIIPVMQLFLMDYAATNDVRNVPLAVYDQNRGSAARELLDAYRAADYFRLAFGFDSEDQLRMR